VFAIGLIVDTAEIKRIGAPVMGVTLLVALGLLAARAWCSTPAELDSAQSG
jgi:Kef-type K+ transport system membrane component KefB